MIHQPEHVPTLMTLRQAAKYTTLSERTLRREIAGERLATVRVGRCLRLRRQDLDSYVGQHRVPARDEFKTEGDGRRVGGRSDR
ncbi:helix-turn-helix domain-containing protein [Ornithinimicrobium sediminis]|uniref:helix-turn-helix domain-containing protein n=1 Tax=Ornithinimicrobium sediminis TaxID=2904603 RepID=UPI0038CD14E3